MNAAERKKLKNQVELEYETGLSELKIKRDRAIEAIDHVWELTHPKANNQNIPSDLTSVSSSPYGSLSKIVRLAIASVPKAGFTRQDVFNAIRELSVDAANNCKPSSLSGCLVRLCKQGVIEQCKEGVGRTLAIYRIKNVNETTNN
jgi:hypothetical protein